MSEPSEARDTHDASTCDAFPLAVGLAQVQARLAKTEALADKLAEALGQVEPWIGEIRERPYTAAENLMSAWNVYAREALIAYQNHKG